MKIDIATILQILSWAIEEEPKVAERIKSIFSKPDPTVADWDAEIAAARAESYGSLVPNSQLPPDAPTP